MKEVVVFFLNGEKYGIEITSMQSFEDYQEIRPLPDAPEGILGTVEIRHEFIPVLDINSKLAVNRRPAASAAEVTEQTKILMMRTRAGIIACRIDGVWRIHRADGNDIQIFPEIAKRDGTEFVDFIVRLENELVVIIKPDALLTDEQAEAIQKIDFSKIGKEEDEEEEQEEEDKKEEEKEE